MGKNLRDLLLEFKEGKIDLEEMEKLIKLTYFEEVGEELKLDINRKLRTGVPEVVYGLGKEVEEIVRATIKLAESNGVALATKVNKIEDVKEVLKNYNLNNFDIRINEKAKTLSIKRKDYFIKREGYVGVVTAGTADIPIAEEAIETLNLMGVNYIKAYDVGIAGVHRLFPYLKEMLNKRVLCIITIAGMEGALPSLISSLVDVPVIGVPTTIGYGVKITPLLTMLHSCSPGLAVVNLNNGFGAAVFAGLIVKNSLRMKE